VNGRTETGAAATAARTVVGATALAGLVRPASEPAPLGAGRSLPVLPELAGLLPHGVLRRGSVVAVATGRPVSNGGTSLLLALLAQASRAGSWCAVVGLPELGMAAAADLGIALDRFALVPAPGPDWTAAVAALIDGLDVVVVAAMPATVGAAVADRLAARARQRGCVLVSYGPWTGADVTLRVVRGAWEGLGHGRGRLRRREVVLSARGRGAAARPKEVKVWLPGADATPAGVVAASPAAADVAVDAAAASAAGCAPRRAPFVLVK